MIVSASKALVANERKSSIIGILERWRGIKTAAPKAVKAMIKAESIPKI
jgi:hypothetical protein